MVVAAAILERDYHSDHFFILVLRFIVQEAKTCPSFGSIIGIAHLVKWCLILFLPYLDIHLFCWFICLSGILLLGLVAQLVSH